MSQNIEVMLPANGARTAEGLLGNADGDPENDFRTREGEVVSLSDIRTVKGLYARFGESWRVRPEERLFSDLTAEEFRTSEFLALPSQYPSLERFSAEERFNAEQECRDAGVPDGPALEDCAYDILADPQGDWATQAANSSAVARQAGTHLGDSDRRPPDEFTINLGDTVSPGQPRPGAGAIETPGSKDTYHFEAKPGQIVFFDFIEASDSRLNLLIEEGKEEMKGKQLLHVSLSNDIRIELEKGGWYTITVDNPNEVTSTYSFRLSDVPPSPGFTIKIGDEVSNGQPQAGAGNIETPGAQDIYRFEARPGQIVYFDNRGADNSGIGWQLEDAAGNLIFPERRDRFILLSTGDAGQYTLERGGTYTITVVGLNDAVGKYGFKLGDAPPP